MAGERVHLVLTAVGTDRPGIVEEVSDFILARGGNIEESRMAVLGGEFTLMVLVSGEESAAAAIEGGLGELSLQAIARRTTAPNARVQPGALAYRLRATSLDHPGIVQRVSHLLAERGVNIERAECRSQPGPWSGAPVFHLEMVLAIPDQKTLRPLREALEQLSVDEGIDVDLCAVTTT